MNVMFLKIAVSSIVASVSSITPFELHLLRNVLKENDIQPEIDEQVALQNKIELQMNMLVDKLLEGILDDSLYRVKQKQLESKLKFIKKKLKELE